MQNNDTEERKPLKLEQPFSTIYSKKGLTDSHNAKDWWGISRKVTKQNLEDAWRANKAFVKEGYNNKENAMAAPEGDSNDYFLKAAPNLVARQNTYNIGHFLDNFHGMDYFRKAVPEVEKGLKGTGYDMGPSANVADNLKEALDKDDTEEASKEVENIIEEHPEESQEVLPEDTPIQEEAEQITEDDDKRNDEVNNEVVEDFVEDSQAESELFPVGYTTEQVTDPNVGSISEYLPENNRPLDSFVLNNYDDDKDRGELAPAITSNNDNEDEVTTETNQIPSDTDDSDTDSIEDFEAYAQDAQDEYNKALAEQKAKDKEYKKLYGGKTGITDLPSTGMLGGKHWYEVDPEKLYEYADTLIDDGEGLLGEASAMGRQLSETDSWNIGRGRVGSLATYGNGLIKRGKRLKAVRKYLQEHGINPAELKPSIRKKLLRQLLPGDKYNRKGKQEDYEHNLSVILNSPSNAPGEVNNEAVSSKLSEDFDTVDDLYNYLIDWDKVKVYKPGEEMYPGEHSNEWENEPDFDTSEWTADMGENPLPEGERPNLHEGDEAIDRMQERMTHDEDFAGPDELPATYDQIVEPGKELALTNGNGMVPVEEPTEVDYRIIDEEVENDDSIPEEEKEAEKQRRYKNALKETPEVIGGGNAGATTSAPGKGTELKEERRGPGSSFGNSFKASMPNGSYNAPNAKGSKLESKEPKDIKSNAGGGTLPPTNEGGAISVNARNANNSNGSVTSNGFVSSGATNKTGSSLTVKPVSLPNGEVHTQEYNGELANGSADKLTGLAKAHVDNIEARVRELPEDVAEAWGFGIKYKHVEYNGTQLDQCTPNQLNEIEKILSRLGV